MDPSILSRDDHASNDPRSLPDDGPVNSTSGLVEPEEEIKEPLRTSLSTSEGGSPALLEPTFLRHSSIELTSSSAIIKQLPTTTMDAAVSPVAVRAIRDRRAQAAVTRKSADDVDMQRKENERLREILARERYERIHRVANARKDAVSRTLSPLQPRQLSPSPKKNSDDNSANRTEKKMHSPKRANLAPPPLSFSPQQQSSPHQNKPLHDDDTKPLLSSDEDITAAAEVSPPVNVASASPKTHHHQNAVAPRSRSKLLAPLHPLAVDQAATPAKTQRFWDRKVDTLTTKEHDARSQISSEERHNFLLVRRVMRLLREEEQKKTQHRELLEKQADVRQSLYLDEIKGRIRAVALRDKMFFDGVFSPFETGFRSHILLEERNAVRFLYSEFKKEMRLWRAVEHRQLKGKLLERELISMQFNEGRLQIVKESAASLESIHGQFASGRDAIRQAHTQHGLSLLDDKRRKRAEALEAENLEEKVKRQQRQKIIDAKQNEERKLQSSWTDWELLRSRVVYAEQELWVLLMRMFRAELATVRNLAKLQRVEGYCYDALKEMPTVTLTQLLNTAPSSAYISQIAPLPQHATLRGNTPETQSLIPGQNRRGMETVSSFLEPIRRDREDLPKYLKAAMEDETCPLFVGSYVSTGGGMFVDPSVDFSIDMGETWGARLLVCWSYAKEESEKLGKQIIRRMLGYIRSAEKLIYLLGPESSTFRKAQSKKSFVKSRSSKSLDNNRTELLTVSLQDVAVTVPQWVEGWRAMLTEELQKVRKRFPNVPLPDPGPGSSPWQAALAAQSAGGNEAPPFATGKALVSPTLHLEGERPAPGSLLTFSTGPTPTETSLLAGGAGALSGSFVLDVSGLQQLQAPLVEMKAAKERLISAVVLLDALRISGDVFSDSLPHFPCLFIHPSELEELHSIHAEASIDIQRQLSPSSLQVRIKPKMMHNGGKASAATTTTPSSYVSSYVVRDLVRLVRLHLLDQVDEWSIPKEGVTVSVRVRVRCTLTAVSSDVSISDAASLNELLEDILACNDIVEHESDEVIECFLLPFQVLPTPLPEFADEDIPEHDCRTNKPFALCPRMEVRLVPRLERHEEITTEVEGWDEDVQNTSFCFTSRRSSVAMPAAAVDGQGVGGGAAASGSDTNRSPLMVPGSPALQASPVGSPGLGAFVLGSPKSPILSPAVGKKVVSLKREIVRRRTAIVLPNNGECLTACEAKGLEISFFIFDGVSLHDKLVFVPCDGAATFSPAHRTKGLFWEEKAFGEGSAVWLDGIEVASAMQQLCSFRISFLPNISTANVERVCRSVGIHCGQYTSRIGIRVIQIVLSRPYDKVHAPSTSRWVAPSAAYVAVKITATDTPPTFTLPQRICYRGAFSSGVGGTNNVKNNGNTPRAAQLQLQAAEASKLWRVEPKKLAIGKDAVVDDPDTQFFKGGFMTIDVRNYEPGDHVALDLREFDTEGGMDGVRMQFVDDPEGQVAEQLPLAWNAWKAAYAAPTTTTINSSATASPKDVKSDKKGGGLTLPTASAVDRACALLSFHGDAIGLLSVEFHSVEGPAKLSRKQSALWGETGAGAANSESKVSSPSVLRRRKSSVSFQVTPSGTRMPVLLPPSQMQLQQPSTTTGTIGNKIIGGIHSGPVAQSIEFDDDRGIEPEVQKPLSSLQGGQHETASRLLAKGEDTPFTSDDNWQKTGGGGIGGDPLADSTSSKQDENAAIEGISKLRIFFDQRVPFEAIQLIVHNLVYYRGTLLVPSGETLVDITIAPGQTIECFDVHGDMVFTGDEDSDHGDTTPPPPEAVMVRSIIVERSPPLLNIAEKDRTTTYVENSGARRLFAKISPFPSDVVAFEGGYLRVEICQDDLEDEDEIILDVPLEKMRRIFLKLDMLQEHLPDTLGSNRSNAAKKSLSASGLRSTDANAKASIESHVDMRTKVARERAMSLRVIDATPREPPSHNGPPVAVSALRRLGSMKRGKAGPAATGLEAVGSGGAFSPSWSPQDGGMPKHRSPLPFVGLDPPSAPSLPAVLEAQSAKSANLWGKVRKDVSAAATAHRFLATTTTSGGDGGSGGQPRTSNMYSKVFDLVRQSASSHVLVRRMEELERYGIDDTFVYRMQQNDVAQGLQAVAISTSSAPLLTAAAASPITSPTSMKSPGSNASYTPPRSPPPPPVVVPPIPQLPSATVCCLADFDDNSLGTLFTRHGCISIAFDALLPSIVLKGHTLPVQPQAVIQKLLSCLAFRSTSRNPSILQKRITLTLVHPISGRTMVFLKLNIDPVDDPTEIVTLKPQILIRSRATEEEPYSEVLIQSIWAQRARHGVHFAMPESSVSMLAGASTMSNNNNNNNMTNAAACVPRWGLIPLLPSWSTTVFDPDTLFWDGGRIELHTSHVTLDGANFTSKVTAAMRQQLQNSLRLLTAPEQRELRGYILKYGLGSGGAGEVPPESQAAAKWDLHSRQAEPGSRDLSIFIQEEASAAHGRSGQRLLATVKFPEDMPASETASLLLSIQFCDDLQNGEKWITVDMLATVLNNLCVERADALRLVESLPMNTSATTTASTAVSNIAAAAASSSRTSYVFPIHIRVWDPVNPKCGEAVVSIDISAPMLSWPQCTDSAPGSPHEDASPTSSAKERRLSLPSKVSRSLSSQQDAIQQFTPEGDFIVYTSLRELTAVQGEACFQHLIMRIPDKDRVGGGFIELIPLGGHRPEDRFTVLPPSNQMVITTDGVITSKEGNLGRIYGNNNSSGSAPYLRIDLAGYWFEGSKKLSYNANKQDLIAPLGIDPSNGSGRITISGGIAWSKQVSGRVSGKRFTTLLRSIYFRTETPDGVGASSLVGTRRFVLNVSDGKYDAFGRLEVTSVPLVIQVTDGPLPKF